MAKLSRQGSVSDAIRNKAVDLTTKGFASGRGLRQKDFVGEARKLLEFVRDEIRYVKDIDQVETLHDPVTLLQIGAGDCDDKAILLASLLLSIGHTPRFIAMAQAPEEWSHVWVQDCLDMGQGDVWVDLEPTEPIPFGKSVPLDGAQAIMTQDI